MLGFIRLIEARTYVFNFFVHLQMNSLQATGVDSTERERERKNLVPALHDFAPQALCATFGGAEEALKALNPIFWHFAMELEIDSVWYTDVQHLIKLSLCTSERNLWKKESASMIWLP